MNDELLVDITDGIATLTLNRPDKRNALTRSLIESFNRQMSEFRGRDDVRVIIITGAGPAFCAGMDLEEVQQHVNKDDANVDASVLFDLFNTMRTQPQPIIAAVNGHVMAGGAGLMTACDLIVMSCRAKVGYPETKRGLVAAIVMPFLIRQIGERRARRLLLTGSIITAEDAYRIGLVNELAEPDQVISRAHALADELSHCGPQALALTKEYLADLVDQSYGSTEHGVRVSAEIRLGQEAAEGLKAFLEKRLPAWCPRKH